VHSGFFTDQVRRDKEENEKWLSCPGSVNPHRLHREMGDLMTEHCTVVRYNDKLRATDDKLGEWIGRTAARCEPEDQRGGDFVCQRRFLGDREPGRAAHAQHEYREADQASAADDRATWVAPRGHNSSGAHPPNPSADHARSPGVNTSVGHRARPACAWLP
jgi:succinate dehydrogenase/fumarate reductase flavoprotein subunit